MDGRAGLMLLGLALLCAGCGRNSGAVPLGSGAYLITIENGTFDWTTGPIMREAVETARQTCGSREVVPISTQARPATPYVAASVAFTFRCAP